MFTKTAVPIGQARLKLSKRGAGSKLPTAQWGQTAVSKAGFTLSFLSRASPARSEFDGLFNSQLGMMEQMDREFQSMEREMMQMDNMMNREMYRMLDETRRISEQARRDASEMAKAGAPNVSIERSENVRTDTGYSRYQYYERVEIHGGYVRPYKMTAAQTVGGHSALLIAVAAVLTGVYAGVAATFNTNYHLTTFKTEAKWKLVLLWPVLMIFSSNFRQQVLAAIQGRRAAKKEDK